MITGPVTRQVPHLILVETAVIKRLAFCSVVAVLTNAFPRDFVTSTSILTATVILCNHKKPLLYLIPNQTVKYLYHAFYTCKSQNIYIYILCLITNHKISTKCLITNQNNYYISSKTMQYLHFTSHETIKHSHYVSS